MNNTLVQLTSEFKNKIKILFLKQTKPLLNNKTCHRAKVKHVTPINELLNFL